MLFFLSIILISILLLHLCVTLTLLCGIVKLVFNKF